MGQGRRILILWGWRIRVLSFQKTNEEKEEPNGKKSRNKAIRSKTEQDERDEKDAEDNEDEEAEKEDAEGENEDEVDEDEETDGKIEEIKKPKRKPALGDESSELDSSRYGKLRNIILCGGGQGWRSGESTRLPPIWPRFDSWTRCNIWVEFVVGFPDFPSLQKPTFPKLINANKFKLESVPN